MRDPLATPADVADVWRPLTDAEELQVLTLIEKASAKLRQKCPFDVDERIALHYTAPGALLALDPAIVADVVATIVKRFLVNADGYASKSTSVGPYSESGTFVNRYDKTGSDVRGAVQVIESDIDQLRPSVPTRIPASVQLVPTRSMRPPIGYLTEPAVQQGFGPFSIGAPSAFSPSGSYLTGDVADDTITDPSLTPGAYYHASGSSGGVRAVTDSATVAAGEEVWVRAAAGQAITIVVLDMAAGETCTVRRVDDTTGSVTLTTLSGTIAAANTYPLLTGVAIRLASDGSDRTVTVL